MRRVDLMSKFVFRASKKFYPSEPISYLDFDVKADEKFPTLLPGEVFAERRFEEDLDATVKATKIMVGQDLEFNYSGKEIRQDPIPYGTHKLHPIEIIIDENVVQEISRMGRKVCQKGKRLRKLETAGFLAGKLKRDKHGRLWTHVTKSVHNPPVTETSSAVEVTITREHQRLWSREIERLGLEHVGMWHTHPTYEPWQSDARFAGADVQATAKMCQHWWSFSMVVDPFGEDYDYVKEKEMETKTAAIGCYKMVSPGTDPDDLQTPLTMGWRSVAFGIRKDGAAHE
jgi:proteasome lid subunit RPN8/RPN11